MLDVLQFADKAIVIRHKEYANSKLLPLLGQYIQSQSLSGLDNVIASKSELWIFTSIKNSNTVIESILSFQLTNTNPSQYILPVTIDFDEDWTFLQRRLHLRKDEIVRDLEISNFSISMFGFQAGFFYLEGLPEHLHVPRKDIPKKRVEAGSFAIGGPYAGVYPQSSPGGWYTLGRASLEFVRMMRKFSFSVGDRIILKFID